MKKEFEDIKVPTPKHKTTFMEWLMINGWLVLIIIIVISALMAFNVIPINHKVTAWKEECDNNTCVNISVKTIDAAQVCGNTFNCVPQDIKILGNVSIKALTKDYYSRYCTQLNKTLWQCGDVWINRK